MQKAKVFRFLVFLFFVILSPQFISAEEFIRMALVEFPPLMSKKMENYGCETAIVSAAFKSVNIETQYSFIEPAGAFERTKRGLNFDALVGWVWSKEREEFFYYSDPILEVPLVFFHLKTYSFDWGSYNDLRRIPIGIVTKNFYGIEFHKALNAGNIEVQKVPRDKLNFGKLLYKRIKLLPYNLLCGYFVIQTEYGTQKARLFTHHPKPLKVSEYHVLFSKANKKKKSIVELFNKGLHQIKESGKYDELMEKCNIKSK